MTYLLWQVFVSASCLVALLVAYSLLMRLLRTVVSFVNDLVNTVVALLFFLVIVPPLWIWEKGRRPMWRTLSPGQTRQLQAWLKHRRYSDQHE